MGAHLTFACSFILFLISLPPTLNSWLSLHPCCAASYRRQRAADARTLHAICESHVKINVSLISCHEEVIFVHVDDWHSFYLYSVQVTMILAHRWNSLHEAARLRRDQT